MAEFDVPGLSKARMALTAMAKQPKLSRAGQLIRALYTEIRAARLAGYSWKSINTALRDAGVKPYLHNNTISSLFHAIDEQCEKETGVKALPAEVTNNKRKKKSPGVSGARDPERINLKEIIS